MATDGVLPLLAGLVSAPFAALVWRQYAASRRSHALAWGLGLSTYAVASLIEAFVSFQGWSVPLYRGYFPLAAATVAFLGLGTLLLALPRRADRIAFALVAILVAVAAFGQLLVPLDASTLVGGPDLGAKPIPLPNPGRIAFLVMSVVGGLALIGGALWSFWTTRRFGVLLIGVGAMLPFAGGSLSTLLHLDARVTLQFLGVAVMFAGYLQGMKGAPERPAVQVRPDA